MTCRLLVGDCRDILATFAPDSIDACVTDPPYGLEFMGKEWDRLGATNAPFRESLNENGKVDYHGKGNAPFGGGGNRIRYGSSAKSMQAWHETWAREVYRVLKPGAHMIAMGGDRTYHRLVAAIEDAGFEIRHTLVFLHGQGFPKNHDPERAIAVQTCPLPGRHFKRTIPATEHRLPDDHVCPMTPESAPWEGWGTAMKPSLELICLARKPMIGTVAANVTAYGTGGLNIDGCRIAHDEPIRPMKAQSGGNKVYAQSGRYEETTELKANGRWPANALFDQDAAAVLDAMSGELGESKGGYRGKGKHGADGWGMMDDPDKTPLGYGDTGGASRFFFVSREGDDVRFKYTSKADRAERNKGLEGMAESVGNEYGLSSHADSRPGRVQQERSNGKAANHHPTVKPIDLMQWLVRLITPPGGTVLDCFCGSGTTGIAADREGFNSLLIDQDAEYVEIARRRIIGDAPLFAEVEMT